MAGTAIIGVGNKLMGDEGVGVHAIEFLRVQTPSPLPLQIQLLDGGTGGMTLYHLLCEYEEAIIIDAADFKGRPGEVRSFNLSNNDISLTPDSAQVSLHGTSLAGILQLAETLGTKLPSIHLILVQPEKIAPSMELSNTVKDSLTKIKDELLKLIPTL